MKKQHLWGLAAVLVVLLLVRLAVDRRPDTASSLDEAGLALLFEQGPAAADVSWIRVAGPGDGEDLVAERVGTTWRIASAHGAPADGEAVEGFLRAVTGLRGELRGEGESLNSEFGVDESSASRVDLGSEAGKPLATLWIGAEGDARGAHFVRVEGSSRIHHAIEGVSEALGLQGSNREPSPERWVRLELFDLGTTGVTRIQADRPDQNWLLEKAPPHDGEDGADARWRVAEPATNLKVDAAGIEALAGRLVRVRATSVLDPASEACAREALTRRLSVQAADGEGGLDVGSEPLAGDLVAARLDGDATCWGLSRWTAESLMPRASQVFELSRPLGEPPPEAAEFTRLDLVAGDRWIRLDRDGDDWRITQPQQARASAATVDRMLSALRFLAWDDLAVEAAVGAADRTPHATVTARAGDRVWTLRLLGERSGGSGRYADFEGGARPPQGSLGVVTESVVESLTPDLEELRAPAGEDG